METIIVFYCIILYTLVFFINRWLYFQLQKIDEDFYPNPPAVFTCFLFLLGTVILTFIVLLHGKDSFFKLKKK
jgi:hypothetical protein